MNAHDRTRVYCCFKACPACGARRGEYCRSNGKVWTRNYHWQRGPNSDRPRMSRDERKRYTARYEKLKAQVLTSGPIPGHE